MTTTICQHDYYTDPHLIGYVCLDCGDETPECGTCHKRPTGTSSLICDPCLNTERQTLDDIRNALTQYTATPRTHIKGIRYDTDRITAATDRERLPFGLDAQTDDTGRGIIRTPHGVIDVLTEWATAWEDTSGSAGAHDIASIKAHLIWAAHNPILSAWDDYRREMRQLRHHARRIAGLLPERQPAPCVHCGGRVVQDWADETWTPNQEGLSDQIRCTGCGMTWNDRASLRFTNRHTIFNLPDTNPDNIITLAQARIIYPHVPRNTMNQWVKRDRDRVESGEESRLPVQGKTVRGDSLYRLADIHQHVKPDTQTIAS